MSRVIYVLDVETIDDDVKFNPSGIGYRVYVYEHGEELGDGMALTLSAAITEALEQADVL